MSPSGSSPPPSPTTGQTRALPRGGPRATAACPLPQATRAPREGGAAATRDSATSTDAARATRPSPGGRATWCNARGTAGRSARTRRAARRRPASGRTPSTPGTRGRSCARLQGFEDPLGEPGRESWKGGDLRSGCRPDARQRAEVLQQGPAAVRADAWDGEQLGGEGTPGAAAATVADREAMGLVTHALQQLQAGAAPRQAQAVRSPGEKHLLLPFREADDRQLVAAHAARGLERGAELSLAAVDDHEVGEGLLLLEATPQEPGDYLVHGREVVLLARTFDPEAAVLGLLGTAGLEPHERADGVAPLVRRDVDAHQRARHRGGSQVTPQVVYGIGGALFDVERLDHQALEEVPGVLLRQIRQPGVGSALGH